MRYALLALLLTACASPRYEHVSGAKSQTELDADWYACSERFAELVSRDPLYGDEMRERCLTAKGWRLVR